MFVIAAVAAATPSCADQGGGEYFGTTSRTQVVRKDEATFYLNNGTEPEYLDPGKSNDLASSVLIAQLFEGLTAYHPKDLHPTPGVAERWDRSDDGRRYRFHLREAAKWSDGRPVTAHDFEYAWKRVLRPKTASRASSQLHVLKNGELFNRGLIKDESAVGVRAASDRVLEVELEQPTPYFLELTSLATLCPVRRDVIERYSENEELWVRPENIVVNGPYTLDAWRFRYEITMKRSPFYWDRDKLRIHRIVWLEVEDYRSTMNLYKAGEIDFIGPNLALPAEYMDVLSTKKDFRRFPYLSSYWYDFNTSKPPVDDVRVRWALNLAVNKREIVEKITRSGQIPATHYVPDFTGGGYAAQVEADKAAGTDPFSAPEMAFNPARARALLEEAGYKVVEEGDGYRALGFPPLEILYNTSEGHRNIALAIQSMWRAHLGVSVTLRNEDWKVMLKNLRDGHFQIARSGYTANYNHPHTFLDLFLSYSPENRVGWVDKEYDATIKRALTATGAESIRLYRQAEAMAVAGMGRLPLYFYTKSTLVKPWVKGYYGNARNAFLAKWVWIDNDYQRGAPDEPSHPPLEFPPPGRIEGP